MMCNPTGWKLRKTMWTAPHRLNTRKSLTNPFRMETTREKLSDDGMKVGLALYSVFRALFPAFV